MKTLALILASCLLVLPVAAQDTPEPIIVGSKLFTADVLLGHLVYVALEDAGYTVVDALETGNTAAARTALLSGEIGIYPEYTGTAVSVFFEGLPVDELALLDTQSIYSIAASYDSAFNDIIWLEAAPYSDSYNLTITTALAEAENLYTLSDFARYVNEGGTVLLASDEEFANRSDGLAAFESGYGFDITGSQLLVIAQADDRELFLQALEQGANGINVVISTGVDGLLYQYDVVTLEDDLERLLPYEPAPVIRGALLRRYPEIVTILNPLFRSLSDESMIEMVARVEIDGESPRQVALDYLSAYKAALSAEETPTPEGG